MFFPANFKKNSKTHWQHQTYSTLRSLKENIEEDEIILQIESRKLSVWVWEWDLSSHSTCRCSSHHSKTRVVSVCCFSSTLHHDPSTIWVYPNSVLPYCTSQNWTQQQPYQLFDGPTIQNRSKKNLFFLSRTPFQIGCQKSHRTFWRQNMEKAWLTD